MELIRWFKYMCGIIGIIGDVDIKTNILTSLKNLTNRGYDSVGVIEPIVSFV